MPNLAVSEKGSYPFKKITNICCHFPLQQLECEPLLSEEIRQDISCFVMLTSWWRYHLQGELVEKAEAIRLEAWRFFSSSST